MNTKNQPPPLQNLKLFIYINLKKKKIVHVDNKLFHENKIQPFCLPKFMYMSTSMPVKDQLLLTMQWKKHRGTNIVVYHLYGHHQSLQDLPVAFNRVLSPRVFLPHNRSRVERT